MTRRRRQRARLFSAASCGRLVLDGGALAKLADGDPVARAIWRELTERGWQSLLPAAVLSEVITGRASDARTNRLIAAIGEIGVDDEALGWLAGALRFRASARRKPSGVDALVAAHGAARPPSIVLTGDIADLEALLADVADVAVITV